MRIGLIDVDGHNFPNLPLMKISAWHKSQGDSVEWYDAMTASMEYAYKHELYYGKVYMSKIFSFTPDYANYVIAAEIQQGGSGYCISIKDGKEAYSKENDIQLPYGIEHTYPDYSLYPELTKDTAYGFMSRGCPRGCDFCHVAAKEGRKAYKAADLSEFWQGQKNVTLLDPNPIACREWEDILGQLIDSGAWVDFSQGVDIRLMTEKKADMIRRIKTKNIHFAWDKYEDKDVIIPKLKEFKEITGWDKRKMTVYVLTNFDTTTEQDLERIYTIRDLGYWPYVMIYDKGHTRQGDTVRKIQRWVNMRAVFEKIQKFEDYSS